MTILVTWLNDQVLRMAWLHSLLEGFVENVIGLSISEGVGGSIHFFLYDTIKIFILLSVLIYLISFIQSYFPPERTKQLLGGMKGIRGNTLGALLGTLTPFCSCSSIPIFMGFTAARLPIGVTFSFLISSPLVDLASVLILISFFGIRVALAYVLVGLVIAILGGTLIDKLGMEKYVEDYVRELPNVDGQVMTMTGAQRLSYAKQQVREIIQRVWKYILIGVGIGAWIHNWIPVSVVEQVIGAKNPFAVFLAAAVGIPMYADLFGTLPIAEALFLKGVGIGTVLAFMMAVTALSLPSMIMLSQVVKRRLLIVFTAIVTTGIIIMGYTFNAMDFLVLS